MRSLRLRHLRRESGMTLIEVVVALSVFSVVTLGIFPLLLSSLRSAAMARSHTVGKNVAVQAMERIRGLPFFISYGTQNTKVDVLDLYYPCAAPGMGNPACPTSGASYSNGTFITTCTNGALSNPACPRDIPIGVALVFQASFVKPGAGAGSETYDIVVPATDYAWNSTAGKDTPPSQLLDISAIAKWTVPAKGERTFWLRSLVGDRVTGDLGVSASAQIHYGIQVLTTFTDPTGDKSVLTLIGGNAESVVQSRLTSEADQTVRSGQIRIASAPSESNPSGTDIAGADGATSLHHAPPDGAPSGTSAEPVTVTHPALDPALDAAYLGNSATQNVGVAVANELPTAQGQFLYTNASGQLDVWATNQATADSALRLAASDPMVGVHVTGTAPFSGSTSISTRPVDAADRATVSTAGLSFPDLRILPTTFINGPNFERGVVLIQDFSASASCTATGSSATASASASWGATLSYWQEDNPNDGQTSGRYVSVPLGSTGGADPLAEIKAANPMVYEDPTENEPEASPNDVYLFATGGRLGYLSDWSSSPTSTTQVTPDGKRAQVDMGGAIRIDTEPTNPALPDSGLNISVGKLACEAVDNR